MHLPEPHTFISSKEIRSLPGTRLLVLVELLLRVQSMRGVIDKSAARSSLVESPMATHTNDHAAGAFLPRARRIQVQTMTGQPSGHERGSYLEAYLRSLLECSQGYHTLDCVEPQEINFTTLRQRSRSSILDLIIQQLLTSHPQPCLTHDPQTPPNSPPTSRALLTT